MDTDDRVDALADENTTGTNADLASSTLIGSNMAAMNAGTFPGAIVAPAAELAANEADARAASDDNFGGMDIDSLSPLRGMDDETADERVSPAQKEAESDELNG